MMAESVIALEFARDDIRRRDKQIAKLEARLMAAHEEIGRLKWEIERAKR